MERPKRTVKKTEAAENIAKLLSKGGGRKRSEAGEDKEAAAAAGAASGSEQSAKGKKQVESKKSESPAAASRDKKKEEAAAAAEGKKEPKRKSARNRAQEEEEEDDLEDEVAESPKKSPDKGKEKPAKGQAAKGRSKGNKDKEQDENKEGEDENEGELITDEIVAVKKEISITGDIADEMIEDEIGKEAEEGNKSKEGQQDSVEKQMEEMFVSEIDEEGNNDGDGGGSERTESRNEDEKEDPEEGEEVEEIDQKPLPTAAGLEQVIELGKGTVGRCGACRGCQRESCGECSACKRGHFEGCIDKYCSEEESGRLQRAHMKELYLKYLREPPKKKREGPNDIMVLGVTNAVAMQQAQAKYGGPMASRPLSSKKPRKESLDVKDSDEEDDGEGGGEGHGENQENKMTVSPGSITITKSGKVRNTNYVYGSGRTSSKSRRCGECEGCMRDDCGHCVACQDKPKFGGKGTKKRACVKRACLMKGALKRKRSVEYAEGSASDTGLAEDGATKRIRIEVEGGAESTAAVAVEEDDDDQVTATVIGTTEDGTAVIAVTDASGSGEGQHFLAQSAE